MAHIYLIFMGQFTGALSALTCHGNFPQLGSNMSALAGTHCSGRQWKSLLIHPIHNPSSTQCQF